MNLLRNNKRTVVAVLLIPFTPIILVLIFVLGLLSILIQFCLALTLWLVGEHERANALMEEGPAPWLIAKWWRER